MYEPVESRSWAYLPLQKFPHISFEFFPLAPLCFLAPQVTTDSLSVPTD